MPKAALSPAERWDQWWQSAPAAVRPASDTGGQSRSKAQQASITRKATTALSKIYGALDREPPKVSWYDGPLDFAKALTAYADDSYFGELLDRLHMQDTAFMGYAVRMGIGPFDGNPQLLSAQTWRVMRDEALITPAKSVRVQHFSCFLWLARYFAWHDRLTTEVGPQFRTESDAWAKLARIASFGWFTADECLLAHQPTAIHINSNNRLSNTSGPALKYADGFALYALNGLRVDPRVIEDRSFLNAQMIEDERNLELRRVLLEYYGAEKYMREQGATLVAQDEYGQLFHRDLTGDEPLVMVKVRNSTAEPDGTFKDYMLRVPPHIRTPRHAIAWTFGLTEDEYEPAKQT